MKKLFFILFIISSLAVNYSCKRIKSEPPAASTLDTLIQPPVSVLYVPVQYKVSAFEELMNEKIQGKFINKWINLNDKGDSLHIEVSRTKKISLSRKNRTLIFIVPLKISGQVKAKFAGVKIKNDVPVEAEISVHLATTLHLDSMWNMVSETKIQKIDWIKEPKLKVAFIQVNLRGAIENMLEKNEDQLTKKADGAIPQLLNTRKVVTGLWRDIQNPISINKKGVQIWLKAYGVDLNGRLQDTDPDLISLLFELKTITRIYFGGDSIPPSNAVVPAFRKIAETNDSLTIYVHSLLRFDMINELLNRELGGKPISAKGFSTTIKNVRVYGTPTGIAVELKVKGDINGTLYVKGTPAFDSLTNTLSLRDFDFDVSSESSLLNSADWLLHSTLLEMISEKLNLNLTPLAAQLPRIIMQAIEKGKTGQKIDINVDTLALHPQVILSTKNNLQLLVKAQGRASVTLEKKLFNKNDKKVLVR